MNLKEIRLKREMSQSDVANKLGCSPNVQSRYERGERQPSIEVLIDLSNILGVTVDYLIGNHEIESTSLSKYEIELIKESRSADERARQDAILLLQMHKVIQKTPYYFFTCDVFCQIKLKHTCKRFTYFTTFKKG